MVNNPYQQHLKIARSQRRKLERIAEKLTDMSIEWDGIDGGMETDLDFLASKIREEIAVIRESVESWRKGHE